MLTRNKGMADLKVQSATVPRSPMRNPYLLFLILILLLLAFKRPDRQVYPWPVMF